MGPLVTYKYQAISKSGQKVSGVVEGFNERDAVDRIRQSCNVVLKLTPVREKEGFLNMEVGGNRLNKKAFTLMCSQFAIILRSGVPLVRTTQLIAAKTTDKKLKKILTQVADDVEAGRSLSASFKERGDKYLPQVFLETISAGESSGTLDQSFQTMYEHYDKQTKIQAKVKSALTYPIFVICVGIVVVIVLMIAVVPTFTEIFAGYGAELPLITQSLIGLSNFFKNNIIIIAIVVAAIIVIYKLYTNTEGGRLKAARASLKIPVLGNIRILTAASEFANTLTMLIASGMPITSAVSITARTMSNYYLSQEIGKLSAKIEEGQSLGDSLRQANCMPDILVDMLAVGEETGELEQTMGTTALYYDAELQLAVDSALKKLEPTTLVLIAGFAGYIVIAIYVAMFQMYAVM